MSALKLKSWRFVGIGILTLFLLAMSLSFAHQGHSYSTPHSDFSSSAATGSSLELNHVAPNTLITDVCIGAIFLLLIVGRKYLHGKITTHSELAGKIDRLRLMNFTRPPNLVLRLSLPQLGVFRI
ncbi:MAG: hypothetical protein Q8K48_08085 [Candidatus Planktophila sp.]|nr:hypothetical protein [Candidatus Planktophila sp.]